VQSAPQAKATVERSDVCATPAAAVIAEAVVAVKLATALLDKFGGQSVRELKRNVASYRDARQRWQCGPVHSLIPVEHIIWPHSRPQPQ
jgi:hypothetical protein